MSYSLNEEIVCMLKQLIQQISGLHGESELFKSIEKNITTHVKNADTLYFCNQKELDRIIESLCKKFEFHGYPTQAKDLKRSYNKLAPAKLSKSERLTRLNIIKFILDISESPTSNIHKYAKNFEKGEEEEIIDWPKYLREDIPRWSPPPDDDSSDDWSDILTESISLSEDKDLVDCSSKPDFNTICEHQTQIEDCFQSHHNLKVNLLTNVQSEWFNRERVRFLPRSEDKDANVALVWDSHIQNFTRGLIPIQNSNIITEYKIMREVIWQLYEPHASYCFAFHGNLLLPKLNITISSVRMKAFESFLYEFVPYINWLQILREFHESLAVKYDDEEVCFPPDTYRSYDYAIQTIVQPIFEMLQSTEEKIKAQETTTTLLTLAHEIRPLFETVKILKDIHNSVIVDFKENSPLHCATTLLVRLRKGLLYASSKLEQDLFLTLYLHSLYKYFTIINTWLCRDILDDNTGEFVIADENPKDSHVLLYQTLVKARIQDQSVVAANKSKARQGESDWQMEFSIKDNDNSKSDSLLNIICTQVLQIGKNIHLLRVLGKLHLVPECTGIYKATFYEAYIENILKHISVYFDAKNDNDEGLEVCDIDIQPLSPTFVFPATCLDECKYLTEMDKLENLVDTSDGFLVQAFQSFFIKTVDAKKEEVEISLFEKITKLTKTLFPVQQIVEHVFVELLKERFSTSGLMVKNVLINDYSLEKQFSFLKNVFLFSEDLIFPLYRHIFMQLDSGGIWGNRTWLTSLLQDIIMDAYPNFYKECTVEVKDSWKLCNDPLKACRMINVHYRISWPVNIIIREEHMEMYKNIFQFILKIKWALYTLNHLYFSELEPKGKPAKHQHKSLRILISKLKILRFGLINIMSNIQHYILGHIFSKFSDKFNKAFDEAYDLESLMKAHNDFIQPLHKTCQEFQEYNNTSYGFYLLLYLVRKLRSMWRNIKDINDQELEKCEKSYLMCHRNIDPIINPSGYYAYMTEG